MIDQPIDLYPELTPRMVTVFVCKSVSVCLSLFTLNIFRTLENRKKNFKVFYTLIFFLCSNFTPSVGMFILCQGLTETYFLPGYTSYKCGD